MEDFYKLLENENDSYKIKHIIFDLAKALLKEKTIVNLFVKEFEELPHFMNETKKFMIKDMGISKNNSLSFTDIVKNFIDILIEDPKIDIEDSMKLLQFFRKTIEVKNTSNLKSCIAWENEWL